MSEYAACRSPKTIAWCVEVGTRPTAGRVARSLNGSLSAMTNLCAMIHAFERQQTASIIGGQRFRKPDQRDMTSLVWRSVMPSVLHENQDVDGYRQKSLNRSAARKIALVGIANMGP